MAKNCPKAEQWLAEKFDDDFMVRFRKEVIEPIKKEKENQLFFEKRDKDGKGEFDF